MVKIYKIYKVSHFDFEPIKRAARAAAQGMIDAHFMVS